MFKLIEGSSPDAEAEKNASAKDAADVTVTDENSPAMLEIFTDSGLI